jgi:hypothetical protein
MNQEHLAKRLDVSFIGDTDSIPSDVVMASTRLDDGIAKILIVKRRFADLFAPDIGSRFLITQRQRNDFALALIHEVVHLQNPDANPNNAADYAREESRAWREVSRNVVRQLRALHQPMHQTYIDVDDALVRCGDRLPCPALDRMVRLHHWTQPLD